jgi:hypothetical protein
MDHIIAACLIPKICFEMFVSRWRLPSGFRWRSKLPVGRPSA